MRFCTVLLFAFSSVAARAAVGDSCNLVTFVTSCDATTPTSADECVNLQNSASLDGGTVQVVNCDAVAPGSTCGASPSCDGSGCASLGTEMCVAQDGGRCAGFGVFFDNDPNNDALVGAVLCAGDDSCQFDGTHDVCVPHVGPACTAAGDNAFCVGGALSICVQNPDHSSALASNVVFDCGQFGSTCGPQTCECDAQCGTGNVCDGGVCSFGVTCSGPPDPSACNPAPPPPPPPQCVVDSDCGRDQVCSGGTCLKIGPGEGEGEGAGEGEGEGASACRVDGDCAGDKVCDVDGLCKEPIKDTPAPQGCFGNATSTTAPRASLLWIAAAAALAWRRRITRSRR